MSTLIINFFAGPGVGKSTTAAELFALLKKARRNVEIAHEYAKDLTWEQRFNTLAIAPYVFGKQYQRVARLMGQVDCIITDSPILLQNIYKGIGWTPAFETYSVEAYKQWNTFNVLLERNPERWYNPAGRNQTEDEAIEVDKLIEDMLLKHEIDYHSVKSGDHAARTIFDKVATRLPNHVL